jgi:hypothetical protein
MAVVAWLVMGAALFSFAPLWGEAGQVGALRAEYRALSAVGDSLEQERRGVVGEAELLSARIDSLKAISDDSEELHEALRASLGLVQRMVEIDRQLEAVKAQQDSLRERLRLSYDWEIGVLIQRLSQEPDKGLLTQLMVYQEAREQLGNRAGGANLRYGEEMSIGADDGPEEIRQKMELLEDMAARLQSEARAMVQQLKRLEEEHRLRLRVRTFTSEISLFDEHVPEGRVLVRVNADGESGRLPMAAEELKEAEMAADGEREQVRPEPLLQRDRETARQGAGPAVSGPAVDDLVLEIHKLKARQQEIRELEALVRERTETFRSHLHKMLEGKE